MPGRSSADEITLFNSVGIALQDLAIGSLLLERARANNIGLELDMSS
jgi:ornithine cyclodeaminase/alanine dehydrogenase